MIHLKGKVRMHPFFVTNNVEIQFLLMLLSNNYFAES